MKTLVFISLFCSAWWAVGTLFGNYIRVLGFLDFDICVLKMEKIWSHSWISCVFCFWLYRQPVLGLGRIYTWNWWSWWLSYHIIYHISYICHVLDVHHQILIVFTLRHPCARPQSFPWWMPGIGFRFIRHLIITIIILSSPTLSSSSSSSSSKHL